MRTDWAFLILILLSISCLPAFVLANTGKQDSISPIERRSQFTKVKNCIVAYREYCTLRDSFDEITDQSMQLFESLFEPNARVINDLFFEPPYPMDMRDYVSLAYNHLDSIGIEATLTNYRFMEIAPEKYPFIEQVAGDHTIYLYDLPMTKMLMTGIDNEGKAIALDPPRKVRLVFTVHYYPKSQKALIAKIVLDEDEK
jgi:hypothetical protein